MERDFKAPNFAKKTTILKSPDIKFVEFYEKLNV